MHSEAHIGCINDIAFGQDSNLFVTVDEAGALKVWDLSEYKCLGSYYPTKASAASSVTFASDDQTVIVGYRDGTLKGFDILSAKAQIWEVSNAHRGHVSSIYADSNYILTGG